MTKLQFESELEKNVSINKIEVYEYWIIKFD